MDTTALWPTVIELCMEIRRLGGTAYVVGGAARDLFIAEQSGIPVDLKDVDIEVFGIEPNFLEAVLSQRWRIDVVGKAFGIIKLHGLPIDVSVPRRERKTGVGHSDFAIDADPTMTVEEAAARRDFTINAISFDPLHERWVDPYNGRQAILDKVLDPVTDRFKEDSLRVLRGMQFIARFDLTPTPRCLEMCRELSQDNLPKERLFEEWKKLLLRGKAIKKALYFLRDIGWLERFYPELFALVGSQQHPQWHPEGDVFEHTALVVEAFTRGTFTDDEEKLVLGLAALCHDLGKPETAVFGPTKKNPEPHWTNHNHEHHTGPAERFLARLTNETKLVEKVLAICRAHMTPSSFYRNGADLQAFRRLALRVPIPQLVKMLRFDQGGRGPTLPPDEQMIAWFEGEAARAGVQHEKPKPIVLGRDLIERFKYPSGPKMGQLLNTLMEKQLAGEFATKEDGLAIAAQLIHEESN